MELSVTDELKLISKSNLGIFFNFIFILFSLNIIFWLKLNQLTEKSGGKCSLHKMMKKVETICFDGVHGFLFVFSY